MSDSTEAKATKGRKDRKANPSLLQRWLGRLGVVLAVLLVWKGLVVATGVPPFILPGPERVLVTLFENLGLIAFHAWITMTEVLIGLILGAILGFATAISIASSKRVREIVRPILVFTQTIPVFALAPLLTLWLGYGLWSKVAMALIIIYFPVTSAFTDALLRTPKGWIEMARIMRASPRTIMWRIRVPAALPGFASGLRLGAVYAPIGAIIGEWVGASQGLGYLMLLANGRAKTDLMFAALIVLAILTLLLHAGVDRLARRYLETYAAR